MSLERRYRRLLACYPRAHRDMYQEEMLGVLLDAAAPDQTWPTVREAASILLDAGRQHLRRFGTSLGQPAWRQAASVLAAVLPVALLVIDARTVAGLHDPAVTYVDYRPALGPSVFVPPLAWAAVVLAALAGPRILAAVLGWAAFAVGLGVEGLILLRNPAAAVSPLWLLCLSTTTACVLTWSGGARAGLRLLGWRRAGGLMVAGALPLASLPLHAPAYWGLPGWLSALVWWPRAPEALALAGCLVATLSTSPPLRRRLLAILAPFAAVVVLQIAAESAAWPGLPRYLEPLRWGVLLLVPLVVFRAAVALAVRRDAGTIAPGTAGRRPAD